MSVKELKKISIAFKEKISGVKADMILRVYAIFCHVNASYSSTQPPKANITDVKKFSYEFIRSQASNLP